MLLVVTISFSISLASVIAADSFYIAAVYEHKIILNPDPSVPLSRHDALQHMKKNLDIYEEQAALAAQKVCTRLNVFYVLSSKTAMPIDLYFFIILFGIVIVTIIVLTMNNKKLN